MNTKIADVLYECLYCHEEYYGSEAERQEWKCECGGEMVWKEQVTDDDLM
jgi:DNA-directed RNA polymerase subunit RPC12/RpoP